MTQFEYHADTCDVDDLDAFMTNKGLEGWEAYHAEKNEEVKAILKADGTSSHYSVTHHYKVFFKREKE